MALSVLYAGFQDATLVRALFYGIKPAVVAVVAVAVLRIARRALTRTAHFGIAAAAFVAIYFFDVPFPLIIVGAGIAGYLFGRLWPLEFSGEGALVKGHPEAVETARAEPLLSDDPIDVPRPRLHRSLVVLAVGLAAWLTPTVVLLLLLGPSDVFVQEGFFFSSAAVVTFGGAYSVLAYVAQQAVDVYAWLAPGEMLDGLGMAETTPGPLIMVVQFVGFMGAFRQPGTLDPFVAGALAGLLVSWVTFVPSFLWTFLGAPYAEHLRGQRHLTSALTGVTAAVVGVILNLALWFALQTLFAVTSELRLGPLRLYTVELTAIDAAALLLTVLAFVALVRLRWPLLLTLAVSAALGYGYYVLGIA